MTSAIARVRAAGEADVAAIADLFLETYSRPLDVDLYRWKVWGQAAEAATAWVAEIDGAVVGHYGGTPFPFVAAGRPLRGMHACHAMTHPAYRRRGVLTALSQAAHAAWTSAHVDFVLGLPEGDGWGSRRQYLGWREVGKLVWRRRPLRWDRILESHMRGGRLLGALVAKVEAVTRGPVASSGHGSLSVREVTDPRALADSVWDRFSPRYDTLVRRNAAWIDYRYCRTPRHRYRFLVADRDGQAAGLLVARLDAGSERRAGWIADLFTDPGDTGASRALIAEAVALMRRHDMDDVRALAMPQTRLDRELGRAGFFRSRGDFSISIVPLAGGALEQSLPNDWFFTGGDFDVI